MGRVNGSAPRLLELFPPYRSLVCSFCVQPAVSCVWQREKSDISPHVRCRENGRWDFCLRGLYRDVLARG